MAASGDMHPDSAKLVKVVYFDEQSASDYLDIAVGGRATSTSEDVKERAAELQGKAEAKVAARLRWLPFLGGDAEVGGSAAMSRAGHSLLTTTISNTILTDYLDESAGDARIEVLSGYRLFVPEESMTATKMYTPYMIIADLKDVGVDLSRLDEALALAKGYYELLAVRTGSDGEDKRILRFNIAAFRNNYVLADLPKMDLAIHAILVGHAAESQLVMKNEIAGTSSELPTGYDLMNDAGPKDDRLGVYDVVLAGVARG